MNTALRQRHEQGASSLGQALAGQVPASARRILHVGCGDGSLGEGLKRQQAGRQVFGIEYDPARAALARHRLDAVFDSDVSQRLPPLEAGSLDCIIFENVLERVYDPSAVVRQLRPLLAPGGCFLAGLANLQHHATLLAILSGDFQYRPDGEPNRDHMRLFAAANIQKLFLDAGCLPELPDTVRSACPPEILAAFSTLGSAAGLDVRQLARKLEVRHFVCRARPQADPPASTRAITFVVPFNNARQLEDNLLASPVFRSGRHRILQVSEADSAARALAACVANGDLSEIVVQVHQDVYLPERWDDRLIASLAEAERQFGPVGIAGVFGVVRTPAGRFERAGRVVDRMSLLNTPHALPARAVSLDELLLVFPRSDGAMPTLEPSLGYHFYGSDACLSVEAAGKAAAILDAPCFHNSTTTYELNDGFYRAAAIFAGRWRKSLPYATTCVQFDASGTAKVW